MDFRKKIDKLLEVKEIALWKLAELGGVKKSTLEKAYDRNGELRPPGMDEFLQKLDVNPGWWKTAAGEIFLKKEPEKPLKTTDVHEVLIESIRSIRVLIDANDRLIIDKRKEVDRLHEDKLWAYGQIDKLTSRIGGADEPK